MLARGADPHFRVNRPTLLPLFQLRTSMHKTLLCRLCTSTGCWLPHYSSSTSAVSMEGSATLALTHAFSCMYGMPCAQWLPQLAAY